MTKKSNNTVRLAIKMIDFKIERNRKLISLF